MAEYQVRSLPIHSIDVPHHAEGHSRDMSRSVFVRHTRAFARIHRPNAEPTASPQQVANATPSPPSRSKTNQPPFESSLQPARGGEGAISKAMMAPLHPSFQRYFLEDLTHFPPFPFQASSAISTRLVRAYPSQRLVHHPLTPDSHSIVSRGSQRSKC